MLHDNQASYEVDFAGEIDKDYEIIADDLGIDLPTAKKVAKLIQERADTPNQGLQLGKVIGLLIQSHNQSVALYALAIAAGLDQLNGIKSETEVAKMHGCTRALVSHYVVGWRDLLSGDGRGFDITKIRKNNETRETYAKQATDPFLAAKREQAHKINKAIAEDAKTRGEASKGDRLSPRFNHPDFINNFWE